MEGGRLAGGHRRLALFQMDAVKMCCLDACLEFQQSRLQTAQRRQHSLAIGEGGKGIIGSLLRQYGGLVTAAVPALAGKVGKVAGNALGQFGQNGLAICRAQLVKGNRTFLLIKISSHALGGVTGA